MRHIFQDTINEDKEFQYTNTFVSDEAKLALEHGTVYAKIDGSNGLLKKENGLWMLYSRYDDKKDKYVDSLPSGFIPLPEGRNPNVYESKEQHHSYYYMLRPRPSESDKGNLVKMNRELYTLIDDAREYLDSLGRDYITVELVGKKFSATPNVNRDVDIALHFEQEYELKDRSYENVKELLCNQVEWDIVPRQNELGDEKYEYVQQEVYVDEKDTIKYGKVEESDCIFSELDWDARGFYKNGSRYIRLGKRTRPRVIVEGFVVEYEGMCWKIRGDMFNKDCIFNQMKSNKDLREKYQDIIVTPTLLSRFKRE